MEEEEQFAVKVEDIEFARYIHETNYTLELYHSCTDIRLYLYEEFERT